MFVTGNVRDVWDGQDSSVGIATRYGLDGQRIDSRWGAKYSASSRPGPPASSTLAAWSFAGTKWPGRSADHPLSSSAVLRTDRKVVGRVVAGRCQRPATTRPTTLHICKTRGG